MKTFGLLLPAGKGSTFEKNVRGLLADQNGLASIVLPMLEAWRGIRIRAAASVWVAVSVWLPSAKVVLVVMSKLPSAATFPLPTAVLPPSA